MTAVTTNVGKHSEKKQSAYAVFTKTNGVRSRSLRSLVFEAFNAQRKALRM